MYKKSNWVAKSFALFLLFAPVFIVESKASKAMAQDISSIRVMLNLSSPHETSLTLAQTSSKKNVVSPKKQEDNSIMVWLGVGGIVLIWLVFFRVQ